MSFNGWENTVPGLVQPAAQPPFGYYNGDNPPSSDIQDLEMYLTAPVRIEGAQDIKNPGTHLTLVRIEKPEGVQDPKTFRIASAQTEGAKGIQNPGGYPTASAQTEGAQNTFALCAPIANNPLQTSSPSPENDPHSGQSPDSINKIRADARRRREQNQAAATRSRNKRKAEVEAMGKELIELRAKTAKLEEDVEFFRSCLELQGSACSCVLATNCKQYFAIRAVVTVDNALERPENPEN